MSRQLPLAVRLTKIADATRRFEATRGATAPFARIRELTNELEQIVRTLTNPRG